MNEQTGKVGRPALSKKEKKGKFISTRVSPEMDKEDRRTRLVAAAR